MSIPAFGGSMGAIPTMLSARVAACEDHAYANSYNGPPMQGDMFAGWPLKELVKTVHPNLTTSEWMQVLVEMKRKHGLMLRQGSISAATPPSRPYSYEERLAMRMNWGRIGDSQWAPGFAHVAVHAPAGSNMVHVWVITKTAQSVVLEDEAPLFPSDALVTKLNMMKE